LSAPGIRLQTSCDRLRELHVSEVFTVITETREAADQFAREGEAACIYVDTIEWCKTFRGMA